MKILNQINSLKSQDIRLKFGEMTNEEMRLVKAVLKWVSNEIKLEIEDESKKLEESH